MVRHPRVEHPGRGSRQRQGPETRLTTQGAGAKRPQLDAAALSEDAGDAGPSGRHFSTELVRKQTKASKLTAVARHSRTRQLPLAGIKRKRNSASSAEHGARHAQRTADIQPELQVPGSDQDSEPVQRLQAETGVPTSSAQTQQVELTSDTVSRNPLNRTRLRKRSQQTQGQGAFASVVHDSQQETRPKTAEQPAQDLHAPANEHPASEQPANDAAIGAQIRSHDSPRSQDQQSPKGAQKRTYCKRTHGTPHPTFNGVKTSTAGVKHMTVHPDVKQIWSAYVMIPSRLKHKDVRMLFLGKNYWSAEAAARAVDRANIALHGREAASTNFPLEHYGPEVCDRFHTTCCFKRTCSRERPHVCTAFVTQECLTNVLYTDSIVNDKVCLCHCVDTTPKFIYIYI